MARTALWAPAHRVLQRSPFPGINPSPPNASPSIDAGGSGIQDGRLPWNSANSSTGAQVLGFALSGHPVVDAVPATLTGTAIAAAQVPVAATPMTLVSTTGAGITVLATAFQCLPSLLTIPVNTLVIETVPAYIRFGNSDYSVFYDVGTTIARNIQIVTLGDETAATFLVSGWDFYGYPMTERITGVNNSTATGKKAFKFVSSVVPAGTLSGSNVSVGQGDTYGLPLLLSATPSINGFWNNVIITGTGTPTAADATSPATATTGDVRGTYLVGGGGGSNGTRRLQIFQRPSLGQMQSKGLIGGLFGVTQA